MKVLVFALCSVALVCSLMSFVEAAPGRQKRGFIREKCPEKTTHEQCIAYGQEKSKTRDYCHRLVDAAPWLEWQSCPSVICAGANRILIREDLSKPFPDCCGYCKVLNA